MNNGPRIAWVFYMEENNVIVKTFSCFLRGRRCLGMDRRENA
jgi:hypothetical protein